MLTGWEARRSKGRFAEDAVCRWLEKRGWLVLPLYQENGLRLLSPDRQFIAPDILAFNRGEPRWFEVKHKETASWYHKGKCWTAGIDKHYFEDYCALYHKLGISVWMFFVFDSETGKDIPGGMKAPTGAWLANVYDMESSIHHENDNWGPHGMLYWDLANVCMYQVASLSQLYVETQSRVQG